MTCISPVSHFWDCFDFFLWCLLGWSRLSFLQPCMLTDVRETKWAETVTVSRDSGYCLNKWPSETANGSFNQLWFLLIARCAYHGDGTLYVTMVMVFYVPTMAMVLFCAYHGDGPLLCLPWWWSSFVPTMVMVFYVLPWWWSSFVPTMVMVFYVLPWWWYSMCYHGDGTLCVTMVMVLHVPTMVMVLYVLPWWWSSMCYHGDGALCANHGDGHLCVTMVMVLYVPTMVMVLYPLKCLPWWWYFVPTMVMVLYVLPWWQRVTGSARAPHVHSAYACPSPTGAGNPLNPARDGDWGLQWTRSSQLKSSSQVGKGASLRILRYLRKTEQNYLFASECITLP